MHLVGKPDQEIPLETPAPSPIILKAGLLIMLGKMIVLLRPTDGSAEWVLPKGHIEAGEDPYACAVREALEETGAMINAVNPAPLPISTTERDYTWKDPDTGETKSETEKVTWFLAEAACLLTEKIIDCALVGDYLAQRQVGIFPPLVAIAKLTYEDHRKVLATAFSI